MTRAARFLAFAVFLGLWTWKLLEPNPVPESVTDQLSVDGKFYIGKSLHAGAYAFLTVLAVTLPVRRYWRWYFVGLLALHGVATEIGQRYLVTNRSGRVWDVLIDWAGIGAAIILWHVFARRAHTGLPPRAR